MSYAKEISYSPNLETLKVYQELIKRRTDYRVYLELGTIYQYLNKDREAEEAYLLALHMVPNRFTSRLTLFDFYIHTSQYVRAKAIGEETLNIPIKIPSRKVNLIKAEIAKKMLQLKI